ncbi:hypothetical protein V1481_20700 [Aeromonas enteropelogenes]|uniref:hypothetical protein n=1 Tax=Aeromonas enteropelogenes TaxID=29489 RepID=UPI0031374C80
MHELEIKGAKISLRHCIGVQVSLEAAVNAIPEHEKRATFAQFVARRDYLIEHGNLRAPEKMNTEGNLPDGSNFYAIKAHDLRAYGWFSKRHKGVFYISHFICKKRKKLLKADTARVAENWRGIEGVK